MKAIRKALALVLAIALKVQIAPALAQPAEPVYTRAVVRSVLVEDGGKRHYIRLKLVTTESFLFQRSRSASPIRD